MGLKIIDKTATLLKANPNQKFTAREIADWIFENFPAECEKKRQASSAKVISLETDDAFVQQLIAEIGSSRPRLQRKYPNVKATEDRPKEYFYTTESDEEEIDRIEKNYELKDTKLKATSHPETQPIQLSEKALYPKLSDYLFNEQEVFSKRIDERKSSNSKGAGGNKWLHPDVVGMQVLSNGWKFPIQKLSNSHGGQRIKLWSFEVKLKVNSSNLRESFFQTVSNSSWANLGYLVAAEIDSSVLNELRLLSARHGIGFIKLDGKNPSESQLLVPAEEKQDLDWGAMNRLVSQNPDFEEYVRLCHEYYHSDRVKPREWDYEPEDD